MTEDRSPLLKALGVHLPDDLLTVALTHRSYAYENGGLPTNERLEFLGDAVLGLVITAEIFGKYPDRTEGELAKLKSAVVNTQALAQIARQLTDDGLGSYLLLGRGEVASGGAQKANLLADGLESLLGATYTEHGHLVARDVIIRLFGELLRYRSQSGRRPGLEDQPAGALCGAQAWRAVIRRDLDRSRARQVLHRESGGERRRIRPGQRQDQEGGRAARGRSGIRRAGRDAQPRCLNCPRSRSSGAGWMRT